MAAKPALWYGPRKMSLSILLTVAQDPRHHLLGDLLVRLCCAGHRAAKLALLFPLLLLTFPS